MGKGVKDMVHIDYMIPFENGSFHAHYLNLAKKIPRTISFVTLENLTPLLLLPSHLKRIENNNLSYLQFAR